MDRPKPHTPVELSLIRTPCGTAMMRRNSVSSRARGTRSACRNSCRRSWRGVGEVNQIHRAVVGIGARLRVEAFQQVREILRVGYGRFNSYRPSDPVTLNSGPASQDQLTISALQRSTLTPVPTWNRENAIVARYRSTSLARSRIARSALPNVNEASSDSLPMPCEMPSKSISRAW